VEKSREVVHPCRRAHRPSGLRLVIVRFIDPDAEFSFVTDPEDVPTDATPFDMRGVELGHHGSECSFETILRRYELTDPVLWRLAAILHEADLEDEHYDAPEAPGFDLILRAPSVAHDDQEVLALTGPIFDAAYEGLRRTLLTDRETP
jgi:hypothetical protein